MPDGTSTTQPSTNSSRCTPNGVPDGVLQGSREVSTAPGASVNRSPTPIGRGSGPYPAPPHPAATRLVAIVTATGRTALREHVRCLGTPGAAVRGNDPRRWDTVRPRAFPVHGTRGDDQNRTGVDGFAGRCLTTRPRRLGRASVPVGSAREIHLRDRLPARITGHGRGGGGEPEGRR